MKLKWRSGEVLEISCWGRLVESNRRRKLPWYFDSLTCFLYIVFCLLSGPACRTRPACPLAAPSRDTRPPCSTAVPAHRARPPCLSAVPTFQACLPCLPAVPACRACLPVFRDWILFNARGGEPRATLSSIGKFEVPGSNWKKYCNMPLRYL